MRKIFGIGETVLDILFRDGQPLASVPGGSTFNSMVSLGRRVHRCSNDCEVLMITDIGDDKVGDMELAFMKDNGMNTSSVLRHEHCQSPISLAFLDENNDASYEFFRSAVQPELTIDDFSLPPFNHGDIVLFGSFFAVSPRTRSLVKSVIAKAKEAGCIIYYDVNYRPNHLRDLPKLKGEVLDNIASSTFVKMSSEDAYCLFSTLDPEIVYNQYVKHLCPCLIITRGSDPALLYLPESKMEFPVDAVDPVSTIGAGDNFNAGFIYSLVDQALSFPSCEELHAYPWASLFASAMAFSREVCMSLYNYVSK